MATAPSPFYGSPYAYPSAAAPPPASGAFPVPASGPYSFPSAATYPPPIVPGSHHTFPFPFPSPAYGAPPAFPYAAYPYPPPGSAYTPAPDFSPSPFGFGAPAMVSSFTQSTTSSVSPPIGATTTSLVGAPLLGSSTTLAYGPSGFSAAAAIPSATVPPAPIRERPPAPDPTTSTPSGCWSSSTTTAVPPHHPATAGQDASSPAPCHSTQTNAQPWVASAPSPELAFRPQLTGETSTFVPPPAPPATSTSSPACGYSTEAAAILHRVQHELLNIQARLCQQQARDQTSFNTLQGELAKLKSRVSQCAVSDGKQSTRATPGSSPLRVIRTTPVASKVFDKMPIPSSGHGTEATTPNYCDGHQAPIQSSCVQGGDINLNCPSHRAVLEPECVVGDEETEDSSNEFVQVFTGTPEQQRYEVEQHESRQAPNSFSMPKFSPERPTAGIDIEQLRNCPCKASECRTWDEEFQGDENLLCEKSVCQTATGHSISIFLWDPGATKFLVQFMTATGVTELHTCLHPQFTNSCEIQKLLHSLVTLKKMRHWPYWKLPFSTALKLFLQALCANTAVRVTKQRHHPEVPVIPQWYTATPSMVTHPGASLPCFSGYKCLSFWIQHFFALWKLEIGMATYILWDPGIAIPSYLHISNDLLQVHCCLLHSLFSTAPSATELQCTDASKPVMVQILVVQFSASIFEATTMCSYTFEGSWTEMNSLAKHVLVVPFSEITPVAKHALFLICQDTHDQEQVTEVNVSAQIFIVVPCSTARLRVMMLLNGHEFLDGQLAYMSQHTCLNDTVLDICAVPHQVQFVQQSTVLSFLRLKFSVSSVQWDPGIGKPSSIYLWLHIHKTQLVDCTSTATHACYSAPACSPPTPISTQASSDTEFDELTSPCVGFHLQQSTKWTSTSPNGIASSEYAYTMDFIIDQWEFLHNQGVKKSYNAKNLLSSPNYLQILTLDILFIRFLPP